jgi:hypothetical protein
MRAPAASLRGEHSNREKAKKDQQGDARTVDSVVRLSTIALPGKEDVAGFLTRT